MRVLLLVTALVLSGTIVNDHGLHAQSRISVTVENFGSFDKAFDLRDGNCGNEWSISLRSGARQLCRCARRVQVMESSCFVNVVTAGGRSLVFSATAIR